MRLAIFFSWNSTSYILVLFRRRYMAISFCAGDELDGSHKIHLLNLPPHLIFYWSPCWKFKLAKHSEKYDIDFSQQSHQLNICFGFLEFSKMIISLIRYIIILISWKSCYPNAYIGSFISYLERNYSYLLL